MRRNFEPERSRGLKTRGTYPTLCTVEDVLTNFIYLFIRVIRVIACSCHFDIDVCYFDTAQHYFIAKLGYTCHKIYGRGSTVMDTADF